MKYFTKTLFSALIISCLFAVSSFAQVVEPASVDLKTERVSDNEILMTFTVTVEKGWHIYSQKSPEGGPLSTWFGFEPNKNIRFFDAEVVEEDGYNRVFVTEPAPHKEYDKTFKVEVWSYADEVVFTQRVELLNDTIINIVGLLDYQLCNESKCVNLNFDFNESIQPTSGLVEQSTKSIATVVDAGAGGESSLWVFFWMAFVGGLLAIIMPCVFPMIPMTVSFFMHGGKSKARSRAEALFFSLSIIIIYTVIGLAITMLLGPDFVNWLSTHWIPNVFFFLIFFIFAMSFFGAFEITLPSWIVNKSDEKADKGGWIGAFFMAFTLVLVSFSCTAPIVGTVLVEAARGSVLRPVIGMLGFSLAIAIPFGFFAFFPQKLNSLPKSGGWLNGVKVVLGFLELALGLKFLMVADQTYHWGYLDREVYIAIWIAIFTLQGLYLLGKIKFRHDSPLAYLGVPRLFLALATFSFVFYLIPGMFGAPLKTLAGYLPPQTSHDFDLQNIIRSEVKKATYNMVPSSGEAVVDNSLCEDPIYSDFLHLPHGIEGYYDLDQAMACAKAQNKPLFIDFTGHGCVNCREMEQTVWGDPRVLQRLERDYIVVALYVDDKKKLPESEWYVSDRDGKTKKSIGKKNADIQIKYFDSNAQPNYVLLDNNGDKKSIRQDILQPTRGHDLDIDAFVKFLDEGKAEFDRRK